MKPRPQVRAVRAPSPVGSPSGWLWRSVFAGSSLGGRTKSEHVRCSRRGHRKCWAMNLHGWERMPSSRIRRGTCGVRSTGGAPRSVADLGFPREVQGVLELVSGCHVQGHLGPRCLWLPALPSVVCWRAGWCGSHLCSRQVTSLFQAGGKMGQRSGGLCQLRLSCQQSFRKSHPVTSNTHSLVGWVTWPRLGQS